MSRVGIELLVGFSFGLVVATITTPVGVSGAVFLLPVQLSVLHVPSPSVTPTNLLYNVIAIPGALVRFRTDRILWSGLAVRLLLGTVPGVVLGAFVRVFLLPDGQIFRILVALFLLPIGLMLVLPRDGSWQLRSHRFDARTVTILGLAAGLVGGIYGIGGGSLLAPVLVAGGYLLTVVAPAALLATFVTSCMGAATYALLALAGHAGAGPDWALGITCGLGGLVGGYLGARLQPRVPQRGLRVLLGVLAVGLAVMYLVQAARA